jgi:diamine N-acetyltransferase
MTIYKASLADAAMLTQLARNIYQEHYLHLWHPGGAQWYMEQYAYNFNKIEKELQDPNIEYYIASKNGSIAGYLKIILHTSLEASAEKNALEIERIYLYKKFTGKGLGKALMELAQKKANALKKDIIFLKAMDSGTDAMAFYKKNGFAICGNLQLPMPAFELMKAAFRGMVIMKKNIT